jgi:hypothetical protein
VQVSRTEVEEAKWKAEEAAKTFQEKSWLESAASQTFQDVVLTDAEQAEMQMWERIRANARWQDEERVCAEMKREKRDRMWKKKDAEDKLERLGLEEKRIQDFLRARPQMEEAARCLLEELARCRNSVAAELASPDAWPAPDTGAAGSKAASCVQEVEKAKWKQKAEEHIEWGKKAIASGWIPPKNCCIASGWIPPDSKTALEAAAQRSWYCTPCFEAFLKGPPPRATPRSPWDVPDEAGGRGSQMREHAPEGGGEDEKRSGRSSRTPARAEDAQASPSDVSDTDEDSTSPETQRRQGRRFSREDRQKRREEKDPRRRKAGR